MDALPRELHADRVILRAWSGADAEALRPVLLANQEHLKPWIPESTWSAPALPLLAERLTEWSTFFSAGRAFRYAVRERDSDRVLGGMSIFPRNDTARVQLADADRVEIGYWLDASVTGRGLVTEAVRALLGAAATLPCGRLVEIRCHVENVPSNAVPKRLGFELAGRDGDMQVWRRSLDVAPATVR